ncbi:rhodanese-related sulfurtransferase [Paenibacillus dendritiformis]|uniref:tRNA uridine(34) hydroxylase n=1 Tax=Paenibacillus dendritiformis C454 TaxID=1131935 RepID=H3SKE6_9BACL|nr:rhodanese-related sulfurtransferase [Paenibacillus dendritiformis]EHQ60436.1 Rhodanese domain-containing protein [Paenibacillus dendritiformis C454]CAH8770603.1 rhodanese-related sulfurtransferase [Paenibacillus dendritiformis]
MKDYRVLLFYKYVAIPDAEAFAAEHLQYCKDLGIKGRILIASEGINGTLSGTVEQTERYMADMHSHPLFEDLFFKVDDSDGHAFKKLFVRHKKELVTLRYDQKLDPNTDGGGRLSPVEFQQYLQRDDVIVLDGRSGYEYDLGHFRNAIRPDLDSFREFPGWLRDNMEQHKDKTILTYCTGGIRCEMLTAVMRKEGFEDVYQLDGGIVTYGKDPVTQGRLFDGSCYVFDERISVPINHTDENVVVGTCYHCGQPSENYINCADDTCHRQHLCCDACQAEYEGYCSEECRQHDSASPAAAR